MKRCNESTENIATSHKSCCLTFDICDKGTDNIATSHTSQHLTQSRRRSAMTTTRRIATSNMGLMHKIKLSESASKIFIGRLSQS